MAQNIYDDPAFFAGYSDFPRSRLGLGGMAEGVSLLALLPPLADKRVVELGCGFGHLSRWLAEAGANRVVGIDLSENMLEAARAATEDPRVDYRRADLDTLELDPSGAELIVSSLTFHYVEDFSRLAAMLHRALTPGGDLVFSVEHPIYSARAVPEWVVGEDGRRAFAIVDYALEGEKRSSWIVDGVVKYHRTIATMLNALTDAGFLCGRMDEWKPAPDQLAAHPEWRDTELTRPMFLLIAMHKPATGKH